MELAARIGTMAESNNSQYWKQVAHLMLTGEAPYDGFEVYDDEITMVSPSAFSDRQWRAAGNPQKWTNRFSINLPNVEYVGLSSIGDCFKNELITSISLPKLRRLSYTGGSNFRNVQCETLDFPLLENFANHEFSHNSHLKVLNIPSVISKQGSYFVYLCTALEDVYLTKMTLAQLGGASYIAQQDCGHSAIFHLADGDYDYQGNPIA